MTAHLLKLLALVLLVVAESQPLAAADTPVASSVISLDGQWSLAVDPKDAGREEKWFNGPTAGAKQTKVPWITQDAFPGYHGVAWYWRDFIAPANPHVDGRYVLRFWQVDYFAEVWLNGIKVGQHEGGEEPFELDVTGAIHSNANNRLAVRVLNPTDTPIDGMTLGTTPHRNKVMAYSAGSSYNHGGIVDSVELLVSAPLRIKDLYVRPDLKSGTIHIQATVVNAGAKAVEGKFSFAAAPAAGGETIGAAAVDQPLPPGETTIQAEVAVDQPRLWQLNDPYLYRVTARLTTDGSPSLDERSARCGFRDFRFDDGYFRLNGRRLFLRCSHTGNHCPIGLEMPYDPDWLRRDLINCKVMGFNAIRFIAGVAKRYQLDLCDEIGLMVYEGNYAGWVLGDSPKMAERFDASTAGMIRRDRNHPSIVMWEILNETADGAVFRHAVTVLPMVRTLDNTRLVMLNSGRFDISVGSALTGLCLWQGDLGPDPNVSFNSLSTPLSAPWAVWAPGQLALHPGASGEYSAIRWIAPAAGKYTASATFSGIGTASTTDVHVLVDGKAVFNNSVSGPRTQTSYSGTLSLPAGGTIMLAVGRGPDGWAGDTTGLNVTIKSETGRVFQPTAAFSTTKNPNGPWSFGYLKPAALPDAATFTLYKEGRKIGGGEEQTGMAIGSLSNPGSSHWENVLFDQHRYLPAPQTDWVIQQLRTLSGGAQHVFLSEYGVGSGVDLARVARHYEQLGKEYVEDARFYRDKLDRFLADWKAWKMAECFAQPEDFFRQSLTMMAAERLLGLNAIRSNPNMVGYSLTGTVDQGMSGEGLTTTFRELKPGTIDAMFDGFAPLRWCTFVEPVNVYRSMPVKLEAVLANEDVLMPGEYPVRLMVVGPNCKRIFERTLTVTIPDPKSKPEPAFAMPVFNEAVPIDGPSGKYRFLVTFERGGATAGGETDFYVADPADMPAVESEVTFWGNDVPLADWLAKHGIRTRPLPPLPQAEEGPGVRASDAATGYKREVILVGRKPPAEPEKAFPELARHIARGSTAIFLAPVVFTRGNSLGWVPLKNKGAVHGIGGSLYHKDEWAKTHPIFDGLPAGGLMDWLFYREIIPDPVWVGLDPSAEAVAGANNVAMNYNAGLMVSVHTLGAGRFVLNTLQILDNLGTHPAAERLLRNMLRYAARDAAKPPAELPPDFDQQLKVMGY